MDKTDKSQCWWNSHVHPSLVGKEPGRTFLEGSLVQVSSHTIVCTLKTLQSTLWTWPQGNHYGWAQRVSHRCVHAALFITMKRDRTWMPIGGNWKMRPGLPSEGHSGMFNAGDSRCCLVRGNGQVTNSIYGVMALLGGGIYIFARVRANWVILKHYFNSIS